ncbi:MAG: hypothetical protein V5A43_07240, partial [Haloarculaceae archaeon]
MERAQVSSDLVEGVPKRGELPGDRRHLAPPRVAYDEHCDRITLPPDPGCGQIDRHRVEPWQHGRLEPLDRPRAAGGVPATVGREIAGDVCHRFERPTLPECGAAGHPEPFPGQPIGIADLVAAGLDAIGLVAGGLL